MATRVGDAHREAFVPLRLPQCHGLFSSLPLLSKSLLRLETCITQLRGRAALLKLEHGGAQCIVCVCGAPDPQQPSGLLVLRARRTALDVARGLVDVLRGRGVAPLKRGPCCFTYACFSTRHFPRGTVSVGGRLNCRTIGNAISSTSGSEGPSGAPNHQ